MADSYNDYPKKASENAQRCLKWVEKNGWGSCGEATGKKRAYQLANFEPISRDTISRMASFKRHQQHKDVPYDEGCGGLMWDAWGGTEGIEWAIRKLKEIDNKEVNSKVYSMIEANIFGAIDQFGENTKDKISNVLLNASGDPVVFNISSEGGDVFEGMAISSLIKQYKGSITAKGIGIVASISSVIMASAQKSLMDKNAMFMIHNCWGMVMGNKEELQKNIDLYAKLDDQMLDIYMQKIKSNDKLVDNDMKKTRKMIQDMMKAETWLTSKEAIEIGLVDGYIMNENKSVQDLQTQAFGSIRAEALLNYKNLPKNFTIMNEKKSILQQIAGVLGLSVRAEEIEIEKELSLGEEKKNEELDSMDKVVEEKDKMIQELTQKLADLEEKMAGMQKDMEAMTKKTEEVTAKSLSKITGKSESNSVQMNTANKYTQDQIKSANALLKQLFNK
jgi:ATP-dependent protease ClpP protease subunit/uncharacterized coiled-coil protein SlyX